MKKTLLCFALLIALSAPAGAQFYGHIGLYANVEHEINGYCPGVGFHAIVMWIWCQPGQNGNICAEFMIAYPMNIIPSTLIPNDGLISTTLGSLATGISVCYNSCQFDWYWIYHQLCFVTDSTPGYIQVVEHPDVGVYQVATCLPGYPTEPVNAWINLYYNDDCPPAP